jgi:hypothetical protein
MAEDLIEIVGYIGDAIGKGQDIVAFFQGGAPTMEDITKAFAQEVQQIFHDELALEDVRQAAADLESARYFFANDYVSAKTSGESDDKLYALINGSDGPGLAKLRGHAELMESWVSDPGLVQGGQDAINKAATLYLALKLFICLTHRELSYVTSDPAEQNSERLNMTKSAADALATMKDVVMNIMTSRCQNLSVGRWNVSVRLPPPDGGMDYHYGATLQDGWLHRDGSYTLNTNADTRHGPSDSDNAAMQGLIAPYQRMLWFGGQDAEDDLTAAVGAAAVSDSAANFTAQDLPALRTFADWAVKARGSLIDLDQIARGATVDELHGKYGTKKQEGWRYCGSCGGMYQYGPNYPNWSGTDQKVCPANGTSHTAPGSSGYLMCYDAGAPASQGGWAWCMACGMLHFGDAGVCPMGQRHGPPVEQVAQVQLMTGDSDTDIQSGWRWCHRCSALHWPSGPSVCAAGGAHSSDGSGNYRVEYLGSWTPPV